MSATSARWRAAKRSRPVLAIWFALVLLSVLGVRPARAAEPTSIRSPFNGLELKLKKSPRTYAFLLVGHLYGSQNTSIYPSASILANLALFDTKQIAFAVLLGDIVQDVDDVHLDAFESSFARRVKVPLFNAIGNHDADDAGVYRKRYAPAAFHFRRGSELFVFVDGEERDGKLSDEAVATLLETIHAARDDHGIANVLVFTHRLLWAIGNPPYDAILPFVNGPESHPAQATDFTGKVLPELLALAGKHVYILSGDVGLPWSFPLFYADDPAGVVTYIATGIGDTIEDTALRAVVDRGKVRFEAVSLTGGHGLVAPADKPAPPLGDFGLEFWKRRFAPPPRKAP